MGRDHTDSPPTIETSYAAWAVVIARRGHYNRRSPFNPTRNPALPSLCRTITRHLASDLAIALSLGAATRSVAEESKPSEAARYDWVPLEQLTPEQQMERTHACRGLYIDPMSGGPTVDPATSPMEVEAHRTQVATDKIQLDGDVSVRQGSRQIQAGAGP